MIDVQLLPATECHLQMILPDVRQADIDELYAVSLMTTEAALRVGLRTATMAWSGFANGELVTMFGVSPASMIGGNGIPWLVSTPWWRSTRKPSFAVAAMHFRTCWPFIRIWKTMSTNETMLPKPGCTGSASGLKMQRPMVRLASISTAFTWRENNV